MSSVHDKKIGNVILDVHNISLSFGGVKALTDISFDVREHEIRAIIGPNGAGKSSMLNCINGVYAPQQGSISFRGQTFKHMNSHQVAVMGVARTFQSLALFKGMSVLDNIMTGRNLKIKSNILLQALRWGPAEREEIQHREAVERIIDFLEIQAYRKARHVPLCTGCESRVWHHRGPDRARHGRGDGHQRPRGGAGLRQKNRRRHTGRGAQQPRRHQRVFRHLPLNE